MTAPLSSEAGLDPADTLALVEDQRRSAEQALDVDVRLLYGTWGIAWLVGFGAFWFTAGGPSGRYEVPPAWTGVVFGLLIISAIVVTAVHTTRATRGIRGSTAEVGAMYGWSWFIGFAAVAAVLGGLVRAGASNEVLALAATGMSCTVVGVLYLGGGATWRDRAQFGLGAWILVTTAAGVIAGLPWLYLVMALAGGGGFLLAAAWFTATRFAAARDRR